MNMRDKRINISVASVMLVFPIMVVLGLDAITGPHGPATAVEQSRGAPTATKNVIGSHIVGLYDIWEMQVENPKSYSNPFDFRVVELRADFVAPSGAKRYPFFGFYDGDGLTGNIGTVWKIRFSPNEAGTWKYTYTWTDGTPGGSGTFEVVDTNLPGPLKIATDNPWYFETARADPFHARGYSLHQYLHGKYGRGAYSDTAVADLIDKINIRVAEYGYNLLMLDYPVYTINAGHHFWQQAPQTIRFWNRGQASVDFSRFHIPSWRRLEQILKTAAQRRIYVFPFVALVDQYTSRPDDGEIIAYLRYMAARLGPFWNNFGYSAVWEYQDIWSASYANSVMTRLHNNLSGLPIPPLLSIHDHSNHLFRAWLSFSMRQRQSRSIFTGNCRPCGQHGGVDQLFLGKPIIGSEDIWEYHADHQYGQPRNGTEVRRGAWGIMMAGVLPVYSEVGLTDAAAPAGGRSNFSGEGEREVRLMFDFFYSKTRYRSYQMLNPLVSSAARHICSGIPGQEYLVYDEDGGSITIDLSDLSPSKTFSTLWFDPTTGEEEGGEIVSGGRPGTLTSPYPGDTVLLLRAIDSNIAPQGATAKHTSLR